MQNWLMAFLQIMCTRSFNIFFNANAIILYIEKDDGEKTADITQTRNHRIIVDCNLDFVQPSRRRFFKSVL